MRSIQPPSRRNSPLLVLFGIMFALAFGGVATAGGLWAAGVPLPFLQPVEPRRVEIPVNARPIGAYTAVTRADMIDVEKRSLASIPLRPEQIVGLGMKFVAEDGREVESSVRQVLEEQGQWIVVAADGQRVPLSRVRELGGALMSVNDIIGRVVAKDKSVGLAFTEAVFLPKGTRPGVTGGIPAGMQAMTLAADKLIGVHGLKPGDRMDLLATIPFENLTRFGGSDRSRLPGAELVVSSASNSRDKKAGEARLIAQDVFAVTPVTSRAESMKSSSLTQGTTVRTVPVQEIVLAVHRDDVPHVTEALSLDVEITCVAHSGRPEAAQVDVAPEGTIAVPLAARSIPALARVTRDDLFHPQTRRQKFIYLTPEQVAARRIVTDLTSLLDRVAARDILDGHFMTEEDLLPLGTRPGLAAGIPPGKRAFTLDPAKCSGIRSLRQGERFDVLASLEFDLSKVGGDRDQIISPLAFSPTAKDAEVRVIVQDAVVVSPTRQVTGGRAGEQQSLEEIVIAVAPEEVATLAKSLATQLELTAVTRSSQADAAGTAIDTPGHHPLAGVKTMEMIVGEQRDRVIFMPPRAATSQVIAAESDDSQSIAPRTAAFKTVLP